VSCFRRRGVTSIRQQTIDTDGESGAATVSDPSAR
jgi:hypothetical protein